MEPGGMQLSEERFYFYINIPHPVIINRDLYFTCRYTELTSLEIGRLQAYVTKRCRVYVVSLFMRKLMGTLLGTTSRKSIVFSLYRWLKFFP